MKKLSLTIWPALAALFLVAACNSYDTTLDSRQQQELRELDEIIAMRPGVEQRKLDRIASLKSSVRVASTFQDRFALASNIVEEYIPYQFDSTLAWLARCRAIAERARRQDAVIWSDIKLGEVMATAGFYMESWQILGEQINRSSLSPVLLADYYYALYRLSDNLQENSKPEFSSYGLLTSRDYADSLLAIVPPPIRYLQKGIGRGIQARLG